MKTITTTRTTYVQHTAVPMGRERENGPHLRDLREFVAACEGLDDDVLVRINEGHLDEGGRRTVSLVVSVVEKLEDKVSED